MWIKKNSGVELALATIAVVEKAEIDKGGPGSGPHGGNAKAKENLKQSLSRGRQVKENEHGHLQVSTGDAHPVTVEVHGHETPPREAKQLTAYDHANDKSAKGQLIRSVARTNRVQEHKGHIYISTGHAAPVKVSIK